jgi:hypothetical protein
MEGVRRSMATVGALALAVLAAMAIAAAESAKPVEKAIVGGVEISGDGMFTPKALPKNELTPIAFTLWGKIRNLDGSHPPALKELVLETDKNGAINVEGYPTCTSGKLQSRPSDEAEKVCKSSIIGEGTTDASIKLGEDQPPVPVNSKLIMFNGGVKGGVTTLYVHAFITIPVPAAIVTTVKIKKINKGRYGLLSTATIPKIAGGGGSVTGFKLKVDKKFTYKGEKVSVLTAKCPDGKLQAHATAIFANGLKASIEAVKPCTPKG